MAVSLALTKDQEGERRSTFTKAEAVTAYGRGQGVTKYPGDRGLQDACAIGTLEYALAMALGRLSDEEADAVVSFVYRENRRAA